MTNLLQSGRDFQELCMWLKPGSHNLAESCPLPDSTLRFGRCSCEETYPEVLSSVVPVKVQQSSCGMSFLAVFSRPACTSAG